MKNFATVLLVAGLASPPASAARGDYPLRFFGIAPEPLIGEIDTERPNFSTSPVPLSAGHLQIEAGSQFTQRSNDAEDFTLPLALLRAGLARNLELQIGWDGYSFSEEGDESMQGANDITLALKTQLTEQRGAIPSIGVFNQLSLPTGSSEDTSNSLDPSLGALWTYEFQTAGLFGTTSFNSLRENGERIFQTTVAAGVGFPVAGPMSSYVEYFGTFTERQGPTHLINSALLYLINNNLQLDVVVGGGFNGRTLDYFTGGGVSYRW